MADTIQLVKEDNEEGDEKNDANYLKCGYVTKAYINVKH